MHNNVSHVGAEELAKVLAQRTDPGRGHYWSRRRSIVAKYQEATATEWRGFTALLSKGRDESALKYAAVYPSDWTCISQVDPRST